MSQPFPSSPLSFPLKSLTSSSCTSSSLHNSPLFGCLSFSSVFFHSLSSRALRHFSSSQPRLHDLRKPSTPRDSFADSATSPCSHVVKWPRDSAAPLLPATDTILLLPLNDELCIASVVISPSGATSLLAVQWRLGPSVRPPLSAPTPALLN